VRRARTQIRSATQNIADDGVVAAYAACRPWPSPCQFGKNHLGNRNEYLPTVHGFDEFFGNLYHLNAEEEPEHPDYPKDPQFRAKFGPRGVLRCKATDKDDPTVDRASAGSASRPLRIPAR
jgi:hypothetical protein